MSKREIGGDRKQERNKQINDREEERKEMEIEWENTMRKER